MSEEEKKIVLVVEDEKPLRDVIQKKLENSGFEVVAVDSARPAMDYIKGHKPLDAVWLDHYLAGGESGLDVVATIHSEEHRNKIPVFVVSNTEGSDKLYSYLHLSITKYFVKADNTLDGIVIAIKKQLKIST